MNRRISIWKKGLSACLMVLLMFGLMPQVAKANSMYDATPIAIAQQISGTMVYGEKEQWYSFQTGAEEAYYYIEGFNYSLSKSCSFYLRDDFSKNVASISVSAGGTKTTTPKILNANSTYYVRVSGYPSKTSDIQYDLHVFMIQDDAQNTIYTAKEITTNSTVVGAHEVKGDIDFYTFTTGIGGNYVIDASNNTSRTKSFTVYNSEQRSVGSISVPAYGSKKLENKIFDSDSVYYIKVSGGEEGDYTFRILEPIDDCGNTGDTAQEIALGTSKTGVINYKKDIDYWYFTTGEESCYQISVVNLGLKGITVRMFDEGEGKMSFPYGSLSAGKAVLNTLKLEPNSKYFLAVQSSYEDITYDLLVEAVADDYPDEWKDAVEIEPGNNMQGMISNKEDSDWFKFTPSKAGKYTLKRTGSGVKFEVYSLTAKGQLKKLTSATRKTMNLAKNQTYYIRLCSTSKSKAYEYKFVITQK